MCYHPGMLKLVFAAVVVFLVLAFAFSTFYFDYPAFFSRECPTRPPNEVKTYKVNQRQLLVRTTYTDHRDWIGRCYLTKRTMEDQEGLDATTTTILYRVKLGDATVLSTDCVGPRC